MNKLSTSTLYLQNFAAQAFVVLSLRDGTRIDSAKCRGRGSNGRHDHRGPVQDRDDPGAPDLVERLEIEPFPGFSAK